MSQHSGHCVNWPEGDFGRGPATELCETCNLDAKERKAEALDAIHAIMDGKEWDSDTLQEIAEVLTSYGYTIEEPDDYVRVEVELPGGAVRRGRVVDCWTNASGDGRDRWTVEWDDDHQRFTVWADECHVIDEDTVIAPECCEHHFNIGENDGTPCGPGGPWT